MIEEGKLCSNSHLIVEEYCDYHTEVANKH